MTLKCFSVFLLFLCVIFTSAAQNFEGKIVYATQYKSKLANVTNEQLRAMLGSTMDYLVKEGNYKTTTNGTFFQWQVYVNEDQKIYNKMAPSETLLWNDVTIATDEIIKVEINKGVTTILGLTCDELVITLKNRLEKYYFNHTIKLNGALYANHKFGNFSVVAERTNAVPLKMIVENQQFTMEAVATEVLPMKLDVKIFELPAGSKTEKSPY